MTSMQYEARDFIPFNGNPFGLVYEGALTENVDGEVNEPRHITATRKGIKS